MRCRACRWSRPPCVPCVWSARARFACAVALLLGELARPLVAASCGGASFSGRVWIGVQEGASGGGARRAGNLGSRAASPRCSSLSGFRVFPLTWCFLSPALGRGWRAGGGVQGVSPVRSYRICGMPFGCAGFRTVRDLPPGANAPTARLEPFRAIFRSGGVWIPPAGLRRSCAVLIGLTGCGGGITLAASPVPIWNVHYLMRTFRVTPSGAPFQETRSLDAKQVESEAAGKAGQRPARRSAAVRRCGSCRSPAPGIT